VITEARGAEPPRQDVAKPTVAQPPPATTPAAPVQPQPTLAAAARVAPAAPTPAITPVAPRAESGTDPVRVIQVSPGTSLYDLMTNIYGTYDPRYVPRIQAMNPQMTDPNHIIAGDELRFPEDIAEAARKKTP
jgi:hypothetical protein